MIPDEAVEAAAVAWVGEQVWQDCNEAWQADYMERARVILEAAAPHLTAAANGVGWNDALQYVYEEGYITRPQLEALELSSPYRKTDDAG